MGRIATHCVLLLITFRPEFNPPWIGPPHVTSLTINRLTRREVEAIDRVVGYSQQTSSRTLSTDGIPLFRAQCCFPTLLRREFERGIAAII